MSDKPILFSGPMVRAILEGRKTQTRRVVMSGADIMRGPWTGVARLHETAGWQVRVEGFNMWKCISVPYAIGDRLWVRETWCLDAQMDHLKPSQVSHCEPRGYPANDWIFQPTCLMVRAGRMRNARFMPRWASRLTLIVEDVRLERLQDISEDDAEAEGIERMKSGRGFYDPTVSKGAVRAGIWHQKATESFHALWDSLNAKRAPWDSNPWVVAVTFRAVQANIDHMEAEV